MKKKNVDIMEKVLMAMGEASMCWRPIPSGVFDSERCIKIAERLVASLAKKEMDKEKK